MFRGPKIDDLEILGLVPVEYRRLLENANGYVAYNGGLHVRGACVLPDWHSLRAAWFGEDALHRQFPELLPDDVPFAEDALGDQFVLRRGIVWKLRAECGEVANLNLSLPAFDVAVRADPDEFLELGPLHQFRSEGGTLEPGQLLSIIPPFVFNESGGGVSLRAIPARQRVRFLSKLAREIRDLPSGSLVRFELEP